MWFDFNTNDPGDLDDFVMFMAKLVCFVIAVAIISLAILYMMSEGISTEPEWWINFEKAIGITW